jgi:hypothetical protein
MSSWHSTELINNFSFPFFIAFNDCVLCMFVDGLQCTRKWLMRHVKNAGNDDVIFNGEDKNAVHNLMESVLGQAYLELLEWNDLNPYPEVL